MGTNKFKGGVTILPCKCKHTAQDEIYGWQKRLHNVREGDGKAVCTVCLDEKQPKEPAPVINAAKELGVK